MNTFSSADLELVQHMSYKTAPYTSLESLGGGYGGTAALLVWDWTWAPNRRVVCHCCNAGDTRPGATTAASRGHRCNYTTTYLTLALKEKKKEEKNLLLPEKCH